MDTDYFDSFLETARQKSISKASEKLNLSPPALSKQIKRLESYYGTALFYRSTSGVELTPSGELLAERIQPLLQELTQIQRDMQACRQKRRIRLGTLPSLAAHYLPKRILALESAAIEIELTVRPTSTEIFALLKEEKLDAAVIERIPVHKSLRVVDLFEERFYAVTRQSDSLAKSTSVSLSELADVPLVMYPSNCSVRKTVGLIMATHDHVPAIKTEVGFGDFLLGFVAAGAGMAIVPELVALHLPHADLQAMPIEEEAAKRTISLISHAASIEKALLRYFA
ncbi:UNVERIFIED_CONTAM: LysR family transcriptional activator of glutamate synthase operon [Brevibacillus sp. OAP136]